MAKPSAVVDGDTAAAVDGSAGAASRPAATTSRMPPISTLVSTFWVVVP